MRSQYYFGLVARVIVLQANHFSIATWSGAVVSFGFPHLPLEA